MTATVVTRTDPVLHHLQMTAPSEPIERRDFETAELMLRIAAT